MADEGSYEIHPSGKQLVFLFMAATVVAVVIFLCGVLVGRGVQVETNAEMAARAGAGVMLPSAGWPDVAAAESATPPGAAGVIDDLSYYRRLNREEPLPETLTELEPAPPVTAAESEPASPAVADAESAPADPVGDEGFSVQIAALRDRAAAGALVERLATRGYPAYVLDPVPGAPTAVYRVRVGKYQDRGEAEQVLRRLEREEQFKPWITR